MIANVIYGLVILALIFFILNIKWRSIALGAMDVILWLVCAAAVHSIDFPYQYVLTGAVYEATRSITTHWMLSGLFIGFMAISLLMVFIDTFDLLKGRNVDVV